MQLEQLWSPIGIISILLAGGGVFLIIWNFFRPELSYADKDAIVKQRQENLPLLRHSINAIIKRQKELVHEMGKIPLQDFFNEYLKTSNAYRGYRKFLNTTYPQLGNQRKHQTAILWSLGKYFHWRPICLTNICRDDEHMNKLNAEKNIYYHRNNDGKLSSIIDQLLYKATKYHSALAFAELATNNRLSHMSAKKYANLEEKPEILKGFMTRAYKVMNDRMELLMRGKDLWIVNTANRQT